MALILSTAELCAGVAASELTVVLPLVSFFVWKCDPAKNPPTAIMATINIGVKFF